MPVCVKTRMTHHLHYAGDFRKCRCRFRYIAEISGLPQSAQPMENISDYIDEIRAELAEAGGDGRYAARRNEHYRSDSLRWAQDREEQALDSLKSVFYAGESSVSPYSVATQAITSTG